MIAAAVTNKNILKSVIGLAACQAALEEIYDNGEFYKDLVEYNLCSKDFEWQDHEVVLFHNLPPAIDSSINKLYRKFKNLKIADVYDQLNLPRSTATQSCPLETKWVFHYIEKYKTNKWNEANQISEKVLLTPLNDTQKALYAKMRF